MLDLRFHSDLTHDAHSNLVRTFSLRFGNLVPWVGTIHSARRGPLMAAKALRVGNAAELYV